MKFLIIFTVLFVVTGIGICQEYQKFEFDSLAGERPTFIKPMKAKMMKKKRELAESVKDKISSEAYQILKESADEFDKDTIEVFSNNSTTILSIAILKIKRNLITVEEDIHSFVKSTKRIGGDKNLQLTYSQLQIAGHTFSRVDIKPSYGKKTITTSYFVNEHAEMKYIILILADGNRYKAEIDRFLDKLRFKQ